MKSLFVGIDVSSKNNVAYLMKPDGNKYSSFSVQNNQGGAKQLSERIVLALQNMQLNVARYSCHARRPHAISLRQYSTSAERELNLSGRAALVQPIMQAADESLCCGIRIKLLIWKTLRFFDRKRHSIQKMFAFVWSGRFSIYRGSVK